MKEAKIREDLKLLLDHGIIQKLEPESYKLTKSYRERFKENVRKEMDKKRCRDPYGVALTLTLAQMVYPDNFSKSTVTLLGVIHSIELGLE